MARVDRFTFVLNSDERQILDSLAKHLARSRSDSVRFVIRCAAIDRGLAFEGKSAGPESAGQTAHKSIEIRNVD